MRGCVCTPVWRHTRTSIYSVQTTIAQLTLLFDPNQLAPRAACVYKVRNLGLAVRRTVPQMTILCLAVHTRALHQVDVGICSAITAYLHHEINGLLADRYLNLAYSCHVVTPTTHSLDSLNPFWKLASSVAHDAAGLHLVFHIIGSIGFHRMPFLVFVGHGQTD